MIGGLYWKKGTTKGAYGGMIIGAIIAITGIILNHCIEGMFFDGQWFFLFSMIGATTTYIIVSLLDKQNEFDLDGLLHKNVNEDTSTGIVDAGGMTQLSKLSRRFGITTEFSTTDKIMYYSVAAWGFMLGALFFVPLIAGLIFNMSNMWWMQLWKIYVVFMFVVACISTVWFTIGAFIDVRSLFKDLKSAVRDNNDDGIVEHTLGFNRDKSDQD